MPETKWHAYPMYSSKYISMQYEIVPYCKSLYNLLAVQLNDETNIILNLFSKECENKERRDATRKCRLFDW